jgi:D-galactarolactone cycloisomerase
LNPIDLALRPVKVQAYVLRHPIAVPVRTSFGVMHDRPAVLVRVEDADGHHGWGEAWCNYPACGAEHRARLVETVMAPLLLAAQRYASPYEAFDTLQAGTAVLALQSGEPGPRASISRCGTWSRAAPGSRCGACSAARGTRCRCMPVA